MKSDKAMMLSTALFFLVGIVRYVSVPDISLSPGESVFANYGFYMFLFGLWLLVAIFILIKNKVRAKENEEKHHEKELTKIHN